MEIPACDSWLKCFAMYVGYGVLLNYVYKIISWMSTQVASRKDLTKYGKWAVVTGASEGLGKAYANEMAKSKLNVLLISRTQSKLEEVKKELEEKYPGIEARVLAADLSDPACFAKVAPVIEELGDVGVLVNNAGTSYEYPDFLLDVPDWKVDQLINLNIAALTKMTKIVLKGMAERKRGAIVNISSVSGTSPMSLLTVYSATKVFVDYFSQALSTEYKKQGIVVQSVVPHFVSSNMSKMRPSMMVPTPAKFAKSAVDSIGNVQRTNGFFWHDVQQAVIDMLPLSVAKSQLHNMHLGIRKRALKKKARLAAEAKSE
jgi:17beta-estradiol 17-dehydrogenase / very-long-chain 3-oxoacyl-CoA reductase